MAMMPAHEGLPALGAARAGAGWRAALAIFRKDLVEVFRDRRTFIAAVLLPAIFMPVVVVVMPVLARRQQAVLVERPARIAVEGGDTAGLAALGFDERVFSLVSTPDARAALLAGSLDAVLVDEGLASGGPRVVAVLFDDTRPASQAAVQKVTQVAARLALRDLEAAARNRGMDPAQMIRVVVEPRNVASPRRMGGALLGTALPFFLAVWLLLGGQYAALDVGVGERERGSLEALLVAPPSRWAIVAGKFLAVLAPATLALAVMLLTGMAAAKMGARWLSNQPIEVAISPGAAVWLLVVGLALGGLLSAVQLGVSLAARTLREAQQGFTGLYLLVALPVMLVPFLGDWASQSWVWLVPVLNAALAFRAILVETVVPAGVLWTAGSLGVLSLAAVAWGVQIVERQSRLK
jgi:sodium transport system permease protein